MGKKFALDSYSDKNTDRHPDTKTMMDKVLPEQGTPITAGTKMPKSGGGKQSRERKQVAAKAAPSSPAKHLAYISEEEAKILDILVQIKKGAKGPDGKPIPQTYEPGDGHPTEFLTELTGAQINELLAKTDGESNPTEHGVPSFMKDGSYGSTDHTSGTGTKSSSSSSGGDGGKGGTGIKGNPVGSAGASSYVGDGVGGQVDTRGVGLGGDKVLREIGGRWTAVSRDTGDSVGDDTRSASVVRPAVPLAPVLKPKAPAAVKPEVALDPSIAGRLASALAPKAAATPSYFGDISSYSGVAPSSSKLRSVASAPEGPRTDRAPSTPVSSLSKLATVAAPRDDRMPSTSSRTTAIEKSPNPNHTTVYKDPGVAAPLSAQPYSAFTGSTARKSVPAGEKVTDVFSRDVALDPSIAGRMKGQPTVSGPGKTDREAAPSRSSELASLVSGPGKTDREPSVALDPSISGRLAATRTTTIAKDPKGPMPRSLDTASELGRLPTASGFSAPLADDPGAYNESELARAVTGDTAPAYSGPDNLDRTRSIMSDPTAGTIAPSPDGKIGTFAGPSTISGPGKTDREVAAVPLTSAPGKTDRVRGIIMGTAPVPRTSALPFRNGVPGASLTRVATPPARGVNSVPDSTLSPLATQTPGGGSLIDSPSVSERALQPSRPVAAPSPVSSDLQSEMDSANPDAPPTRGDIGTITPEQDAAESGQASPAPDLGTGGTGTPAAPGTDANPEEPPPEPVPGGGTEAMAGIMPWDRQAYAEIAAAYEAAGQVYTPQAFMQSFYNVQPFTIERPPADTATAPAASGVDPYAGIMPWDRPVYDQMRKSAATAGQTFTPQQFITQFYSAPQQQAA